MPSTVRAHSTSNCSNVAGGANNRQTHASLWQAPSSWRNLTCLANESPTVDDERDRVAHDPKVRHEGYDGNPSDRHEHDAIAGRPVGGPAVDAEVTAIQDNHGYDVED